jgi:hypothetical protein
VSGSCVIFFICITFFNGNIGIVGHLQAHQAISASFLISSSINGTASYAVNGLSASYALSALSNARSASFATTSSHFRSNTTFRIICQIRIEMLTLPLTLNITPSNKFILGIVNLYQFVNLPHYIIIFCVMHPIAD